jgi:diguanylate cyclase (GGDEF)-like protein
MTSRPTATRGGDVRAQLLIDLTIGRVLLALLAIVTAAAAGLAWFFGESSTTVAAQALILVVATLAAGTAGLIAGNRNRDGAIVTLTRQAALLRQATDLMLLVDREGIVLYRSPAVDTTLGAFGIPPSEVHVGDVVRVADGPPLMDLLRALPPGKTEQRECLVSSADGRTLAVDTILANESGNPSLSGYVVTMHDVTKWKEREGELTDQALRDGLTGLPNRALFINRLEHSLAARRRPGRSVAVLYLDLDDFKGINDSLGHVEGDHLLRLAASRLSSAIRPSDTTARLGGDEFAVLVEDIDEEQVIAIVERVEAEFTVPFVLADRALLVGASIGIALSSFELATATDMLRAADIALYRAKDSGKGGHAVFEASMSEAATEGLQLGGDLRGAIEREELLVQYQPIVDLTTRRITSMEAVVSWPHPERGLLGPSDFIPLAERTGLILPLGILVLNRACRQARAWKLAAPQTPIKMMVRVPVTQFADPTFVPAVATALEASGLSAELLTLVITDRAVEENEAVPRRMRQLSALGVGLAVGSFGVGNSSLDSLRQFPIGAIKIDGRFVAGIEGSSSKLALARSIIRLGKSLKLVTIAEGTETEAQADSLRAIGCQEAQGPYFWPPLDVAQASAQLLGGAAIRVLTSFDGQELAVFEERVREFEARRPDLKVEVFGGSTPETMISSMFGADPPAVIVALGPNEFSSHASVDGLTDLGPYLKRDKIDTSIFSRIALQLTTSETKRWALPLLGDAFGLYYNRTLFREAGLATPPMTIPELTAMAKSLTRRRPDESLEIVGFNPMAGFYENQSAELGHAFGVTWFDSSGHSNLSTDPAFARMLRWQKGLIDWFGYSALRRFCDEAGENFSAANAFQTGQLAMVLDGEWRTAFIASQRPDLDYATAPFPVDNTRPDLYGSGCVNCSIVGVPAAARQKEAGWDLARFLATDEASLLKLAKGLRNLPSIETLRRSPELVDDPNFAVFLEILAHEQSSSQPIVAVGAGHGNLVSQFIDHWQAGGVRSLSSALRELDRQIDDRVLLARQHSESMSGSRAVERHRSNRQPARAMRAADL